MQPPPTPPDLRSIPLHLAISRQAYFLWESSGRPHGRDEAFWLEAERQVLGADPQARTIDGGATIGTTALTASVYPRRAGTPSGAPTDPTAARTHPRENAR